MSIINATEFQQFTDYHPEMKDAYDFTQEALDYAFTPRTYSFDLDDEDFAEWLNQPGGPTFDDEDFDYDV